MKIVVDKMPTQSSKCPFSKWKSYPPFIEQPGAWECSFPDSHSDQKSTCNLTSGNTACKWLIELAKAEKIYVED